MLSALFRSRKFQKDTNAETTTTRDPPFTPSVLRYEDPPRRPHRASSSNSQNAGNNSEDDGSASTDGEEDEDLFQENTPLLPIFSAAHLDALPVYTIIHSIRTLIVPRCETTVTWEQLRSPQVSQFLVKPIMLQIRSSLFSRATLYALIANSYQFLKEGQSNPANVGVCRSRALLAELLAMRLLKEYNLRELIDALSYDFDPLAGFENTTTGGGGPNQSNTLGKASARFARARISTLEVAIKAQAKQFLAHPVVVQHLEAIWAGTIVFHSAADNLHRYPSRPRPSRFRHYGATHPRQHQQRISGNSQAQRQPDVTSSGEPIRRAVSLYDASNASIFKLSRLRVPRYRQAFSTISYAIMLGLFIAVLTQRSGKISPLEIVFWFWSAGFILDEIAGFTEQGFGLYIMSVWNAFDIGILVLFGTYFVLRLYSVISGDIERSEVVDIAYDVLGSTAVLLFPRLFAVLDHVRYFSQLLIAFRLMAQDLVAILVLITITCSGFFVAFALSFPKADDSWSDVVYTLFQILMGFTPAAWDNWTKYNLLGRIILGLFLLICHFLVVTILVSVLTNSFMTIVKNANQEHQFLFAVNTISSVKSEALFSYIAPSNLFGWAIIPLRQVLPFRKYVRVNRTVIKATHFPVLLSIFIYERLRLAKYTYDSPDLIERQGRAYRTAPLFFRDGTHDFDSRSVRVREPSVSTYHKDRALEEVFRHPFRGDSTIRKSKEGNDSGSHVVSSWMSTVSNEGGASTPEEQPESILEQLEGKDLGMRKLSNSYDFDSRWRPSRSVTSRSIFSNPDNPRRYRSSASKSHRASRESDLLHLELHDEAQETGEEGDDELMEDDIGRQFEEKGVDARGNSGKYRSWEADSVSRVEEKPSRTIASDVERAFPFPPSPSEPIKEKTSAITAERKTLSLPRRGHLRDRNPSTNTIIFKPEASGDSARPRKTSDGSRHSIEIQQSLMKLAEPRPIFAPSRYSHQQNQNATTLFPLITGGLTRPKTPRALDTMSLDLDSDMDDNKHSALRADMTSMPNTLMVGSFQTQMQYAADRAAAKRKQAAEEENSARMGRLVLARMNTLEEGFKDILKEVKEIRTATTYSSSRGGSGSEKALSRSMGTGRGPRVLRKHNGGNGKTSSGKRSLIVADAVITSTPESSRKLEQNQDAEEKAEHEVRLHEIDNIQKHDGSSS